MKYNEMEKVEFTQNKNRNNGKFVLHFVLIHISHFLSFVYSV